MPKNIAFNQVSSSLAERSGAPIGAEDRSAPLSWHWTWLICRYAEAFAGAPASDADRDTRPASAGSAITDQGRSTPPPGIASDHLSVRPSVASLTGADRLTFDGPTSAAATFPSTETVTFAQSGLVFVNSYGAAVTEAYHTAIIFAENELQSLFTNSVTIRVSYGFANLGFGVLAQNSFFHTAQPSFETLKNALMTHATSADDLASILGFPAVAPSNSHSSSADTGFLVAAGMARILGLAGPSGTIDDALVLGTGVNWNFDPNNRSAGGNDAIGAIEHELTEGGMGRVGGLGFQNDTWAPLDLFRFDSAGVLDVTGGEDGVRTYFSPDGSDPDLTHPYHNSVHPSGFFDGADPGDWDTIGDSFGAGVPGVPGLLSDTDLRVMDVIGWDVAPCFVRGTLIRTETGEKRVEDLTIGDRLLTAGGGSQPIRWIGRRAYDGRFIAGNRNVLPVRMKPGALSDGVPVRDLWLSPQHALYIDGVLVAAEHLVNGATVVQSESVDTLEYFNIEFDEQQVIFAEGAPAESYVDCDNRLMFTNAAEYISLYPQDNRPRWRFCAKRPEGGAPEIAAIRAALIGRAEALGYRLTADPDLRLVVDGVALRSVAVGGRVYRFAVQAGSGAVWLASHSAVPAELEAAGRDVRRLGVAVERIILSDGQLTVEATHGCTAFRDGFHSDEPAHRWTDGRARLPDLLIRPFPGGFTVEVHLADTDLRYRLPAIPEATPAAAA